jgi:membrane-bound lytic murein transglycosylase D
MALSALAACSTPPPAPSQTPVLVTMAEPQTAVPAPAAAASAPSPAEQAPVGPAVDPLRPDVVVDLEDQAAQEAARKDLWQRVRKGLSVPNLETELVRNQEQWYASRPDYVQRMTSRGGRYLFHIVEELERRGMPSELALLPFIESAFNPQAMSSAKASGMWQFMPATGKYFDLKQNLFRDDRRDVLASTRAALDYLQKLYGMFEDWHLALAAYNWGEGNVQRAIARNQKAGLPTDYLSLKMPLETQNYVPKLQAVENIIAEPERFGLALPPLENHPYFLAIPIERDIDVDVAARLSGLSVDEFRSLNPQMNKPVILAAGTPQLLLPYDNASDFVQRLKGHRGPLASWTAWVTPATMRPEELARKVGMSESQLREVNLIPPRMLVKAGSTLLVTRGAHSTDDVSEHVADNASMSLAADMPEKRRMTVKVGRKDTLASLARRHKVSTAQLQQWNQLDAKSALKAGQVLVLFAPQKAAPSTRSAAASARAPSRSAAAASTSKPRARSASATAASPTGKRSASATGGGKPRTARMSSATTRQARN